MMWGLMLGLLLMASVVQAQSIILADNTARNLNAYTCTSIGAADLGCLSIFANSGMVMDQSTQRVYLVGGGHAATQRSHADEFWFSDMQWGHGPASTTCANMNQANWDPGNAWWIDTQQPGAGHTYDALVMFPDHVMVRMRRGFDGVAGGCQPGNFGTYSGGGHTFHAYNTTTRVWNKEADIPAAWQGLDFLQYAAAEYDPVSGLGIAFASFGLWTYNKETDQLLRPKNFSIDVKCCNTLVYYPPTDKFYLFGRQLKKVYELTLPAGRTSTSSFAGATFVELTLGAGSLPYPHDDHTGWVYDSANQIIGGGVQNNKIFFFKPETRIFTERTPIVESGVNQVGSISDSDSAPAGNQMIVYNEQENVYLWMSNTGTVSSARMWLYRYQNVAVPAPPTCCGLKIENTSNAANNNRVVSFGRPFKQGDITNCAHATVNGTPVLTQCNALNRWPDGSLKFAVISFVIPTMATAEEVDIAFYNDTVCNDTGGLSGGQMLDAAYNFDGTIEMTGVASRTISARTILNAHNPPTTNTVRTWLQGPIVTAVIIEDRTLARTYDTETAGGTTKSLHPIFEAWFYPQGNRVELGMTIENIWASSATSLTSIAQTYGLTLKTGNTSPTTEYTESSFNHIAKSRWHKKYWLGSDPPAIRIDHNLAYLSSTKAIANYDTSIVPTEGAITTAYNSWLGRPKNIAGSANTIGNYDKAIGAAGSSPWIGLNGKWESLYLFTFDDRMWAATLGNADLAGRIPVNFREADSLAGTGDFFDVPFTGSVDTFGRVISINARRGIWLQNPGSTTCGESGGLDSIRITSATDGWEISKMSHWPTPFFMAYLFTGRYYYLEGMQFNANYVLAANVACNNGNASRYTSNGFLSPSQTREEAWRIRDIGYAAFLSPDGTPEKAYFEEKLLNNYAHMEGIHNIPLTDPTRQSQWNNGATSRRFNPEIFGNYGIPALNYWRRGSSGFLGCPILPGSSNVINAGVTGFEEQFLTVVLGLQQGYGYNTTALRQYLAKTPLNLMLNPAANKYLIEHYRWPTTLVSPAQWIGSYADWPLYYAPAAQNCPEGPQPETAWNTGHEADAAYQLIAMAAVAQLTEFVVDGYSGQAAYDKMKLELPLQPKFTTESPKWAIVPRVQGVIVAPTDLRATIGGQTNGGGMQK